MKPLAPPPNTQIAVALNRLRIEAAIHANLSHALQLADSQLNHRRNHPARPNEVAVLINFFRMLPRLQKRLNEIVAPSGVGIEIKGVFCHKSGSLGPVVDFDVPPGSPGCELADLLVLVTHGMRNPGGAFGNACFLQAKVERKKFIQGSSSRRQSDLYCRSRSFRFRNPSAYSSPGLPDHADVAGFREMPGSDLSGFAFWSYDAFVNEWKTHPYYRYCWGNASAVALPVHLNDPRCDIGFGNAIYRLMEGSLGLGVAPPIPGDFDWNRIVHDVVLRAISEPLGSHRKIVGLDDLRRVSPIAPSSSWDGFMLMLGGAAAVMNPFSELAAAFESKGMVEAAAAHLEGVNRLKGVELENALKRAGGEGLEPPTDDGDIGPDDWGSSGSFIQINLIDRRQISGP
jgi:hypothetical protein